MGLRNPETSFVFIILQNKDMVKIKTVVLILKMLKLLR